MPAKKTLKSEEVSSSAMTDEDAACYAARYADLNGTDARVHFSNVGEDQGRNPWCVANLTNIQAKRYLSRYPQLNQKVGTTGKASFQYARDYYRRTGAKDKDDISIGDSIEKPWKCADHKSTCQCKGRVYLGPMYANDTGNEIKKFDELLQWKTASKYTKNGEAVVCAAREFGSDPWPKQAKQCFCEPSMRYQPNHCAHEGEACKCPKGTVYFGQRFKTGTKRVADLRDALLGQFAVIEANSSESVNCSAKSFEGADPSPGVAKDCYCDWKNKILKPEEVKQTKQFWRGFLAEKSARTEQVKAEAEAERAQKEAAEAAKEQEAANKKDEETSKKAQTDMQK